MHISTNKKKLAEAEHLAGAIPQDATIRALVEDEPKGALVQFIDGSFAVFRNSWPTGVNQAEAHESMRQSWIGSKPRPPTPERKQAMREHADRIRRERSERLRRIADMRKRTSPET
ncbi:MAG: hypothetical protein OEQ39_02975 [Gammaproteobacteria bacterium]|nr:hypothetical protein [Gammaproteobacteria bacterium]MDH3375913.1 hypothetical protein [Gammaproteobacteria bacterium]